MISRFFDWNVFRVYVAKAARHYVQSAPVLSAWLDDLYVRLGDRTPLINTIELQLAEQLLEREIGNWLEPERAIIRFDHMNHRLIMLYHAMS